MPLKLFHDLMSQPCRALYMFLRTAGIPYEDVFVALRHNKHKTSEYLDMNPFAKVPVLVDDVAGEKIVVKESCAIARYVAAKCLPPSSNWWPMDDVCKSTRIDEYLHWQHLNIRSTGSLVFINAVLNPQMRQQPPNMRQVHRFQKELNKSADLLQNHYLDKGNFITGDKISVADLFAIAEINQPWMAGFDVAASRPRLAAWMEAVKSETQPHYDNAHTVVVQWNGKFANSVQEAYKEFLEGEGEKAESVSG